MGALGVKGPTVGSRSGEGSPGVPLPPPTLPNEPGPAPTARQNFFCFPKVFRKAGLPQRRAKSAERPHFPVSVSFRLNRFRWDKAARNRVLSVHCGVCPALPLCSALSSALCCNPLSTMTQPRK